MTKAEPSSGGGGVFGLFARHGELLVALNAILVIVATWWVSELYHKAPPGTEGSPEEPGAGPGFSGDTAPGAPADAPTRAMVEATRLALVRIAERVEALRGAAGAYPTSNVPANGRNRGIEALVAALRAAGRLDDLGVLRLGDTDGDGREELVDPWGSPLVYFSADDYGTSQEWGAEGGGAATARRAGAQGFAEAGRFQLFSAGPSRRLGRADAVLSWKPREGEEIR